MLTLEAEDLSFPSMRVLEGEYGSLLAVNLSFTGHMTGVGRALGTYGN
jgi:hypothetical protein